MATTNKPVSIPLVYDKSPAKKKKKKKTKNKNDSQQRERTVPNRLMLGSDRGSNPPITCFDVSKKNTR